jgi:multiple sugar transport system substrate-binding protein
MSDRPLLLLLAILCPTGLACVPDEKEFEQSPSSVIQLTYWPAPNQQELQLADSLVRMWNRMYPAVQVRVQPIPVSQSTEEVLLAAIAAGTTPDICSNIWPGALHEYTKAGGLLPLNQFVDFDSIATARTPRALLNTFSSEDGQFHQMPWKTNPVMMFYNEKLFREAGVDRVPRTYSEYLAVGAQVTRDVDGDGRIDVWMGERDIRPIWWQRLFDFYPFYIAASGGQTLFQRSEVVFDNDAAVQVMAFFRECYRRKLFPLTFFQGGDPFLLERKATHFGGPWNIATIQKLAPQLQFGIAPLPVPDDHEGPVYTAGDYKNIAIFSNTRHPKEAWEFVKYMIKAEHDLLLLQIANQIPVRGDLLTNELFASYFRRNPTMVTFAEQAVYTRGMDPAPDLKEIFDVISQEYEASAVYGRKDPRTAVQDAARRARMIIRWNQ